MERGDGHPATASAPSKFDLGSRTVTTESGAVQLNPQILGRAENAHRALLHRILVNTGQIDTYDHWVVLALTAAAGSAEERKELRSRIADALHVEEPVAQSAIDELTAAGLMAADAARVELTNSGQALQSQIRTAVNETTARLYADISAEDLATAGRVLAELTARAHAELTAP
jgi:DNA-binding MarR family transcriptional regulator